MDMGYGYDFESEAKQSITIVQQNTMVSYEPLVTLFGTLKTDQFVVATLEQAAGASGDFRLCRIMLLQIAHHHDVGIV